MVGTSKSGPEIAIDIIYMYKILYYTYKMYVEYM